jgi:hypothetical protein
MRKRPRPLAMIRRISDERRVENISCWNSYRLLEPRTVYFLVADKR